MLTRYVHRQLLRQNRQQAHERDDLKPYVQTLGLRDLESVLALENAAFPKQERESRETVSCSFESSPLPSTILLSLCVLGKKAASKVGMQTS